MYKKIILKNGVRLIIVPEKNSAAVTVLVLVGTGSKYEEKRVNGISHFLEHMYFKGTRKRSKPIDIAETLDKIGGIYNAFTGEEYTGYYAKVAASHFDIALEWVADIFLNSTLPAKEIQKEKGVIIEEINMRYDNPMTHIHSLWTKLLYGDQPAGWDIAGTKESVNNITKKDLANYMQSQYVAANTIVCVAGKINKSLATEKVKKYFEKVKKVDFSKKPKLIEAQSKPEILLNYRKTDQTHMMIGVRGFNIFSPKRYAQKLLAVVLGGMMSSRLFVAVREKMGAAYYINANSNTDTDTGYLAVSAGVDTKKIEPVMLTILKEFKKTTKAKIPALELKKAKDYIRGKTALLLEPSDAKASFYANQELLENKILELKEILKKIDRVTSDDILTLARTIFVPPKLNLAAIGPIKNDKNLYNKIKNKL